MRIRIVGKKNLAILILVIKFKLSHKSLKETSKMKKLCGFIAKDPKIDIRII
tara:strand:- start:653 stop:808 length:156 start_codon:yes stop_codon:yes gene_type:complete